MRRTQFLTRPAYALALGLASLAAVGVVASPAEAQKKDDKKAAATKGPQPTKAFIPVYTEFKTMLDAAGKRPDVIAAKAKVTETERAYRSARGRAAQEAARGQYDAAVAALAGLLSAEKAKADEIYTKVGNDADKFFAGQLGFTYGGLAVDKAMQRRGLVSMIESGSVPATEVGKYNYYAAGFAFDLKDFAAAESSLKAAIAAGYNGDDVKGLLAEAQNSAGRPADALATIKGMVDSAAAAGQTPAADWLERGVLISYQSKSPDAVDWAIRRAEFYPTQAGWVAAGQILRERANFGAMDSLDISRALDRAGALSTSTQAVQREYIEYLQSAVGKVGVLYPGEVIKVANQGIKATALQATDPFVRDALAEANRRLAADKASLAGLERDARAPAAAAKTVLIGADTLLSYDMADKAADLYQIALGKPGADAAGINLRLGIALIKQGKMAEAEAALAKVDGPRKGIAQLWALIAKGKTIPAA
ncbi:MAG: hypothetical protein EBR34_03430 [Sphingomonadaceae bacterium]|nr:hypothetical protein [Sphingomonadaceae bacterium]